MLGGADVKPRDRSFKIVSIHGKMVKHHTGRYHGNPQQAAKKAYKRILADQKKLKKDTKIHFVVREVTRATCGQNRSHFYVGTNKKLAKPVKYTLGGVDLVMTHKRDVKLDAKAQKAAMKGGLIFS